MSNCPICNRKDCARYRVKNGWDASMNPRSEVYRDCEANRIDWNGVSFKMAEMNVDDIFDSAGEWFGGGKVCTSREEAVQAEVDMVVKLLEEIRSTKCKTP